MKFKFDEIKSSFDDLPTDRYEVNVVKMELASSKNKNTPMLKVQYKIIDGDFKGRIIFDQFVLQQNSLWKLKGLLKATGSPLLDKECDEAAIIKDVTGRSLSVYAETTYNEEFDRNQTTCGNYTPSSKHATPTKEKGMFS
jgi:hypothetical protein